MDGDSTIASAKQPTSFASPACNTVTNHPQDADNGDLIEAKKRRGVGTDSSVEDEGLKPGLLEKVLGFIHPTKNQYSTACRFDMNQYQFKCAPRMYRH